jgi:hypothetical protein
MAGKEATIPTERATPKGPGERSRKRLRSASRTAKAPQIIPKAPKAPNSTARNLRCLVAHLLPGVGAVFHVGDVRVAHLQEELLCQSATAQRAQRTAIRDSSSGSLSAAWVLEATARAQGRAGYVSHFPLVRLTHVHHVHVLVEDERIVVLLYARLLRFGLLLGHKFLVALHHLTTFPMSPSWLMLASKITFPDRLALVSALVPGD